MNWPYQYTAYLWPMLASAVFMAVLGFYAWRRRSVPGALPFAIMTALWSLLAMNAALELAAVDIPTRIFWAKFQFFWAGPTMVAGLCFVLEYARLGRFLTRRNLILLFIFLLLGSLLILTNDTHHWIWGDFSHDDGVIYPLRGGGYWLLAALGYLLAFLNLPILIWLFICSPQHRWPVALILCGQIVVRATLLLDAANANPVAPLNPTILASNFLAMVYAIALFGFRMFDPIPMARKTVIEQMREGMLVLDTSRKIVDLNPAAEKLLGLPAARVRGRDVAEILPAPAAQSALSDDGGIAQTEVSLGARVYDLLLSPLKDWDGQMLGHLLLLHDVTEQKRAQAQLLEQQRALAALQERERVARELHDSVGQVLGYVSMQAQAIGKWVRDGETTAVEAQLARLANVAQDAHDDIRESIFSLKAGPAQEWSFLAALKQYLNAFRDHYGIGVELKIPSGMGEQTFEPCVGVQLLRVIQEAMTNARKHGRAHCLQVAFELQGDQARIVIADDGRGFDPDPLSTSAGDHLGLTFMRERMAQIGGRLTIQSRPGAGTQVILQVPIRDEIE